MVRINGREVQEDGTRLLDYLQKNQYKIERLAVERNGEIVPKAQYGRTVLCDGDKIEIVSFVGGG